jgi:hypothetical protein
MLYVNHQGAAFTEASEMAGLAERTRHLVGWGTEFLDENGDGRLDVVVASGSTFAKSYNWPSYLADANLMELQPALLFRGDGEGHFVDVSADAGLGDVVVAGRGLSVADFDHDGAPDVLIAVNNGPCVILKNRRSPGARFLWVELCGTRSDRFGVGARVSVEAGGRTQVREVYAGSSYLSSSPPQAHFGLGAATVDRLDVRWPRGGTTTIRRPPAGARLVVVERGRVPGGRGTVSTDEVRGGSPQY